MRQACDVIVIGAGAAGLMCALTAAGRGRRVRVVERANRGGKTAPTPTNRGEPGTECHRLFDSRGIPLAELIMAAVAGGSDYVLIDAPPGVDIYPA